MDKRPKARPSGKNGADLNDGFGSKEVPGLPSLHQTRKSFLAPASSAKVEVIEKKSRFIGHAAPIFSVRDAEAFIRDIKDEHKSATHNVYAYVLSQSRIKSPDLQDSCLKRSGKGLEEIAEKASDDGEPRGTAGYPVLHAIKAKGLVNAVCVVTRYFGGILLGAGGLIRAYGKAASLALDKAGTAGYVWKDLVIVSLDYQHLSKVKHYLETLGKGYAPQSWRFETKISFQIYVEPERIGEISHRIQEITQGTVDISVNPGQYVKE